MQGTWVQFLGWGDPLEKGMATQSSNLAWRIPWIGEPSGLQSMGLQRVRCDWVCMHCPAALTVVSRKLEKVRTSAMFPDTSVQFSSVAQSCPTLFEPMNDSTPGLPVHHQPSEFTQTHAYRVGDAIQPSHPLSSPSPPAPDPSQHHTIC